jgi:tight adherence protein B
MEPMQPIIIAIAVGIASYVGLVALLPRRLRDDSTQYTRELLEKLSQEPNGYDDMDETQSLLRSQARSGGLLVRLFLRLPVSRMLYPRLIKAGMADRLHGLLVRCLIAFLALLYVLSRFYPWSMPAALIGAFLYGRWSVNRQLARRNNAFLNHFPDALDMIVRSVRSGYPMNSAVRMVADNMQPPVSGEFKQVADEIAYGSTLIEALQRLARRIDEPDVHFFVVVLTVQQDIGGNLSEVLNNLAGIIRRRKHLRLKIRAISSEGRTTAWVLGSMPLVEVALILLVSPGHLSPLFNTPLGNTVLGLTLGAVAMGAFIVSRMVNIKV